MNKSQKVRGIGKVTKKRLLAKIDFLERALFFEEKLLGMLRRNNLLLSGLYLDIGCGGATFTAIFSKYFPETIGLDISGESIRQRKDILRLHNIHCHFIVADAQKLPLRKESLEAVSALAIIEHLSQPFRLIKEVYSVVKKKGIFMVYVPNGFFPIDPHTGIPFAPIIPTRIKNWYARIFLKYSYPIYYLSQKRVLKLCESYFQRIYVEKINYPDELLSRPRDQTKSFYAIVTRTVIKILNLFPAGYIFVCEK